MNRYTEEEYREAAILWKHNNPDKKYISQNEKVVISSERVIPLGIRMRNMKFCPENLTEEQRRFWEKYGLYYRVRCSSKKKPVERSKTEYSPIEDFENILLKLRMNVELSKEEYQFLSILLKMYGYSLSLDENIVENSSKVLSKLKEKK